jgi:RNA polymerase sigma-70 factor (ECF subfamily)
MAVNAEVISKTERFEEIAIVHIDSVHKYALFMAKNENDAKDLVQETYFKAYRFFDKFRENTDCKAWLITILRNTFINMIRHDRRYPQMIYLPEMEDRGTELSGDADPEDAIFGCLFDDDVTAAVNSLPIKYRTVVLLADMEGFS